MLTSTQINEVAIFETWVDVCSLGEILPFSGVAALVNDEQVAIFRLPAECYAISNYDPFSQAYVLSRGIVGDKNGVMKVASPIYKHNFNLVTGQCLDDEHVWLQTWPVRVEAGIVQIAV